jgi:hypothetical protein
VSRRTDNQTANLLESTLTQLEKQANELKASIQYVGTANVVYKQNSTGSTYDCSGTLPYGSGPYFANFLVTATSNVQGSLIADLVWYVFVGGVRKTLADYMANGQLQWTISAMPKSAGTPNAQQWFVNIVGATNTSTIGVKAYVLATDLVSITVAAL